ncbi:hypothetical protein B0H10DRAFT_367458 [Mycena sp. CBHHK59/15]|nr:hypothetical protein B0H10DRAFT_367458 [Mycena sp. CBHHK59/15]
MLFWTGKSKDETKESRRLLEYVTREVRRRSMVTGLGIWLGGNLTFKTRIRKGIHRRSYNRRDGTIGPPKPNWISCSLKCVKQTTKRFVKRGKSLANGILDVIKFIVFGSCCLAYIPIKWTCCLAYQAVKWSVIGALSTVAVASLLCNFHLSIRASGS